MDRFQSSNSTAPKHERGYVLLTAIWLLLLAGSIASLMLLESVNRSRAAKVGIDEAHMDHALDSAIAIVIAEQMFHGRSAGMTSGVSREIEINKMTVTISSTDEASRVDLNAADLEQIGNLLRQQGSESDPASPDSEATLTAILSRRASFTPFRSASEVWQLGSTDVASSLTEEFTVATRMKKRTLEDAPETSSGAIGFTSARSIQPTRWKATAEINGFTRSRTVAGRTSSVRGKPVSIIDLWSQ